MPGTIKKAAGRFPLGQLVATPGALEALARGGETGMGYVARHLNGDWGTVEAEDRASNDAAVTNGDRILSAYVTANGTKIWIISEWDRSVTTILLPDEY